MRINSFGTCQKEAIEEEDGVEAQRDACFGRDAGVGDLRAKVANGVFVLWRERKVGEAARERRHAAVDAVEPAKFVVRVKGDKVLAPLDERVARTAPSGAAPRAEALFGELVPPRDDRVVGAEAALGVCREGPAPGRRRARRRDSNPLQNTSRRPRGCRGGGSRALQGVRLARLAADGAPLLLCLRYPQYAHALLGYAS